MSLLSSMCRAPYPPGRGKQQGAADPASRSAVTPAYDPAVAIDLPSELLELEQAALDAQAAASSPSPPEGAWAAWREAAMAVHVAITEHAAATSTSRVDVEMAVKKAVRHSAPDED